MATSYAYSKIQMNRFLQKVSGIKNRKQIVTLFTLITWFLIASYFSLGVHFSRVVDIFK